MRDHERALQKALVAALKGDAAVDALVGGRVFDQAPEGAAFPYLSVGAWDSRPVAADGGGVEHRLNLIAVSRFAGTEEAKAVGAAVRARLHEATLTADGVRTVGLTVSALAVSRPGDGRRTHAVVRLRAVTEEVASG